jgi:hypothetical protein
MTAQLENACVIEKLSIILAGMSIAFKGEELPADELLMAT